jgi:hypothetical protein
MGPYSAAARAAAAPCPARRSDQAHEKRIIRPPDRTGYRAKAVAKNELNSHLVPSLA